nr:hypothetical protein CFP56_02830 [Quercus suber]
MELSRTVLGADHRDTMTSLNNLALCCYAQERWAEAEALQNRAARTGTIEESCARRNATESPAVTGITWQKQKQGLSTLSRDFFVSPGAE